ncbi:3-methyl-2-oxobutanoate hydroxymethyltransferase [Pengzhenrongella sicca]|uniref:3-methyl-2-oxobutanoate hydroxymethyltransferase n=1 Tax=Pengzhenrongella sicca TaxID=2819238 RepID=A0A8A4ZFG0_9MICO|nr:3-methyl-2-oxobutanoate hydroxymethyltransferase [Pengzhenrongella sicca]QTE28418.1 3-methyl-2-oxobutanoate hydroxymethyltransferase [Pengzhenrongella sicca]
MTESAAGSPASSHKSADPAPAPARAFPTAVPNAPAKPKRVRVHHLREAKDRGDRLTMLTAYDYPTARIFDEAGIDLLLVGDSIGNAMHGKSTTLPVTVDELIVAVRAVSVACERALVIADLPFGSYEASPEQALATAVRMLKEGGANAVKFEGGKRVAPQVRALTNAGIPVVGHLGFTPQSENLLGGKRVQGRGDDAAERLSSDAVALQEAGAVAVVLEMVPAPLAAQVTEILRIPTIGIGAGPDCDGQVLVWLDMAGMGDWSPSFAKQFGQVGAALRAAAVAYADEVRSGSFPDRGHSFLQ